MRNRLAVLIAMAVALPCSAQAGAYMGVGLGAVGTESSLKELGLLPNLASDFLPPVPPFDLDPDPPIGQNPGFDSTDVSVSVTFGWMFDKHFGVEVGYTDFGQAVQNYRLPKVCDENLGCQSRQWTTQMSTSGIQAFVVGSTPIGDTVDAYLKLGAINWDAEYNGFERNQSFVPDQEVPIGQRNEPVNFDNSGTDLAAAMGINLKTESPFSVRVELSYYDIDTTDLVWVGQLMGMYTF